MNKGEKFVILDQVEWVHKDKNGKVIKRYNSNSWIERTLRRLHFKKHQCIVDVGMANVAALMLTDVNTGGTLYPAYDFMAIGSGTITAGHTNTQLGTQKGVRMGGANCVGTRVTTTVTNDTAQWVATFSHALDGTLTGTDAITEVGIFYDSAGTTVSMLMRQTFAAETLNWDAGDTIQFTIKVQVKQGA